MGRILRYVPRMTIHARPGDPAHQTVDAQAFRDAMSRVASAVTIVTTDGPAGRAGFTATAVASVSDHPATLLVCVNRASRSHAPLEANGVFCVNALDRSMQRLADVFAGRGLMPDDDTVDTRFSQGEWMTMATGAAGLVGALAVFDCQITEIAPIATHDIVVGEVVATRIAEAGDALVYADRGFRGLAADGS